MPIYRHTAFLRDDDGHGWSETHDWTSPSEADVDLAGRAEIFNQLMRTRRVPLLAGDGYYLGCRVSKFQTGTRLKVQSFPIFLDTPDQGTKSFSSAKTLMDASMLAIKISFATLNGQARSDVYLRGLWEQVVFSGQLDFTGVVGAQFATLLKEYQDALISGAYGWIGKSTNSGGGVVENYTSLTDGRIEFTVEPRGGGVLPPTGSRVPVFFARINASESVLNRPIVCEVFGATRLVTATPHAAGPFKSTGTYYFKIPSFFGYSQVAYRKLSARKTGRPTGVGRGRLPARRVY